MAADEQHWRRREAGATTIEYVGLVAAVAALLGILAVGIGGSGPGLGNAAGSRIVRLVAGEHSPSVATRERTRTAAPAQARSLELGRLARAVPLRGKLRAWHERRVSGGDEPVHVPRDDLRLSPILPPLAAWERRAEGRGDAAGFDVHRDARACLLCTALESSREFSAGARTGAGGGQLGLEASADLEARMAIAAIDVGARARRRVLGADVEAQGRARGLVGGEASAHATLRLGRDAQELEVEGGAMAGAAAKAEGRVGVELLGIAIQQSGRVEGWAGAGARGTVGVRREGARIDWRFGWGAALGLGGATEWSGSIDVSDVPPRHRRLARRALLTSVQLATFGVTRRLPLPH